MSDLKRLREQTDAIFRDPMGTKIGAASAIEAERAAVDAELDRLRAALRLAHSGIRVYRQSTPCSSDHRPGDLYEECRGCGFEVILETVRAALAGEGEAPCPFCGHDGPLCRDVWPTGQLLCTRPQGHVGDHVACLSSAGVHDAQRWARHATKENGDCADWCRACEDEARARAEKAGEASGDGEAFCACGRRVSECDGSRAACPTPEKAREP